MGPGCSTRWPVVKFGSRHCPVCGCFTDWRSPGESYGKVGVNARLLDSYAERDGCSLFERREIEVRPLDNAGD